MRASGGIPRNTPHPPLSLPLASGGSPLADGAAVETPELHPVAVVARRESDCDAFAAEGVAPTDDAPEPLSEGLALVEALRRNPERYTSEDFLAALDVTRGSETMLSDDPEGAVTTMARVLSAVSRLRREGKPVTFEAVFWTLADGAAADAANAEGLAQLRALGGEPPREPVKTPPRGVAAVPSAPKPLKS